VLTAGTRRVVLPFAGTDTSLPVPAMVYPRASLKLIFTMKTASRSFGFLTSTVAYGSATFAQCTSTAVPSLRGRAAWEADAVGVGVLVGRARRDPPPVLVLVLVAESSEPPPDESLPDEPLSRAVDEPSWS
jgi:hypothetical protein